MRIIHITSYKNGGAGRAAWRIHEALLKINIDSVFISIDEIKNNLSGQIKNQNAFQHKLAWHLKHHFNIDLGRRRKIINQFNKLRNLNCEIATIPVSDSTLNFKSINAIADADIVHLHWVAQYFDFAFFLQANRKPVVWTLHDMNPFSGLFHYQADRDRNLDTAGKLDWQVNKFKARIIKHCKSTLSVITPSHWLATEARKSKVFTKNNISVIPYPINFNEFKPGNKTLLRKKYGIDINAKVLLGVADSTFNYRKGFDLLIEAVKDIKDVKIILIGWKEDIDSQNERIIYTGRIEDNHLLSEYYSLANAVLIPSREDNLPNVMIEAMASGTPVISFKVGGMLEHVKNFETGILAEEINSIALGNAISLFFQNQDKFYPETLRKYAEQHFNEELIAQKYCEIYQSLA
ncbi:MAG: glycosyltransferase [Bacteroidetes bacterium]|nr:glycosyltransferase [Bacteroidota bacterium]